MSQAANNVPLRQNYLVALGSNLPFQNRPPAENLTIALDYTVSYSCNLVNLSKFFNCPAFPAGSGPDFVNAVAEIEGPGDPREMLRILHDVEARLGRERKMRWAARAIDLDIIAAGQSVMPDAATQADWRALPVKEQMAKAPDQLILPHPRLQDRAFVIVPLMDIAPDWRHPLLGQTVREMHDALPEAARAEMVPLA